MTENGSEHAQSDQDITPREATVAPGRLETLFLRFGVIGELLVLFAVGKRWWMAPLVLLLGLFGLVLALISSFEVAAPFIYMAF